MLANGNAAFLCKLMLCLLLPLPAACERSKDFERPDKDGAGQGGSFAVVPFDGTVVGTDKRFDLKASQSIDLAKGTWNSKTETGPAADRKRFRFGTKESITEISWEHLSANSIGDVYKFTLRLNTQDNPTEKTLEITYSGQAMDLFEYGSHRFVLEPYAQKAFELEESTDR